MEPHVQARQVTGVLPLCPFPPLHWWVLARSGAYIDVNATYQKQSLQNRLVIAGPQGRQIITFPVGTSDSSSNIFLSAHLPPRTMWRSLRTAYGGSPFFSFFEDELHDLWMKYLPSDAGDNKNLQSWSWASIRWTCKSCGWSVPCSTKTSPVIGTNSNDLRFKKSLSGDGWVFHRYRQMFEQKNAFIPGCSILDALFVLGPQELAIQLNDLVAPPKT